MKMKNFSPLVVVLVIFTIVFFAIATGVGYYYFSQIQTNKAKEAKKLTDELFGWKFPVAKFPQAGSNNKLLAYSNIRDPGGVPQGLPVRLKIPSIGVNSAIEDALITPDGRMDITAGSVNVAWFAPGPHPGNEGSAVIAGHFGFDNNVPKVFLNLSKLKPGDKVYVEDDKGDTLAFVVRRTQSFDRNDDTTTVFTSGDGKAHLNLITCEGVWNQVNDSYPQRTVVFTDSIPGEGAIAVTTQPKLPEAAKTSPSLTPKPTPSSDKVSEASPSQKPASSPAAKMEKPIFSPQVIVASFKSLYATPLDGMITSLLIISVIFIAFKIIRR
jgi:LPXTG-site transpeptidase (sortase) family protein